MLSKDFFKQVENIIATLKIQGEKSINMYGRLVVSENQNGYWKVEYKNNEDEFMGYYSPSGEWEKTYYDQDYGETLEVSGPIEAILDYMYGTSLDQFLEEHFGNFEDKLQKLEDGTLLLGEPNNPLAIIKTEEDKYKIEDLLSGEVYLLNK